MRLTSARPFDSAAPIACRNIPRPRPLAPAADVAVPARRTGGVTVASGFGTGFHTRDRARYSGFELVSYACASTTVDEGMNTRL